MEQVGRYLGRFLGQTYRDIMTHKTRFALKTLFIWFFVVSLVRVPDFMVQDWVTCVFLMTVTGLIYGAIIFRSFLILRGTVNLLRKIS